MVTDFEVQLAQLRAECDQELAADGDWADITVPARLLLALLDLARAVHHRGNNSKGVGTGDRGLGRAPPEGGGQTPLRT